MVPLTNSLKHAAACRSEPKFSWGPLVPGRHVWLSGALRTHLYMEIMEIHLLPVMLLCGGARARGGQRLTDAQLGAVARMR